MPNKEKNYPIIEEVEDGPSITNADDSDIEEVDFSELPQSSTTQTERNDEPYALAIHDEKIAKQNLEFANILKQKRKTNDHSSSAYGDQFVPTFGSAQFAPSAPDMTEDDVREYEEWLRATSLVERSRFPQHERWQETLKTDGGTNLGFNPVLKLEELDHDKISNQFKGKVAANLGNTDHAGDDINAFLGKHTKPKNYRDLNTYLPRQFDHNETYESSVKRYASASDYADQFANGSYDEIQQMLDMTDNDKRLKTSYTKSSLMGIRVDNNRFITISDHAGSKTGNKYQLWGAGNRPSLTFTSNMNLGYVEGTKDFSANTNYEHIPGRFTITRINQNELGFCFNRRNNQVEVIQPGRYFIREKHYGFIGKATISNSAKAISITTHQHADAKAKEFAARLQLINVTTGNIAFVKDQHGTYLFQARSVPYILDQNRGEAFINVANLNNKVLKASDDSYTFVNNLQPGEFAVIQHRAKKIIWHHDPDEIRFNSFHLPGNYFQLLGDVHKLSDKPVQLDDITVTYIRPNQTLVVRDPKQRIRFIEEATTTQPLTLRRPWHFENLIGKSQAEFIAGSVNDGNAIARVLPGSSDWAVLINQQGRLEFLPSMLNGQPYYFYQPQQTYIRTINQNKLGLQKFDVPGVGEVCIVNLVSGEVASCRIKNVHFMLDVSPQPYIFVAPNLFLDILPANKFHTKVGDLNRIYLKPQQQAVVSVDGKAIILPDDATSKSESQGNGVYIYRSFQFEVYGPENRNKKEVELGPIQFFNVGVGEVAYGNDEHGDLKIWRQGAHIADNNKNQRMQGFYDVNVDPININNLKITSKHMITSHIDVYGSFSITDAVKAISKFKDHKQLHDYISQTIKAEIIRICADRPPIGYSDADFGNAVKPTASKQIESKEDSIATIIDLCKQRSNKLLHNFGIDLSDIDITRWELDPKFTEQAAQSAIKLQKARAENEMEKMASDKQRIENDRKIQEMKSKIDLQKYQNEIKQLEVESKAHTLATEKTAMALAQAKADFAVAEIKAKVTTIESQIKELQAQGEKALGVAKSEVAAANERAKLPDLNAAQRLQLEETKIHGKNLTELISMLAKTQMTMPGVFQLDPKILHLQALSQIAQTQNQPNITLGSVPFATSQASLQTPISNIVSSIGAIATQAKQPDETKDKQAQH